MLKSVLFLFAFTSLMSCSHASKSNKDLDRGVASQNEIEKRVETIKAHEARLSDADRYRMADLSKIHSDQRFLQQNIDKKVAATDLKIAELQQELAKQLKPLDVRMEALTTAERALFDDLHKTYIERDSLEVNQNFMDDLLALKHGDCVIEKDGKIANQYIVSKGDERIKMRFLPEGVKRTLLKKSLKGPKVLAVTYDLETEHYDRVSYFSAFVDVSEDGKEVLRSSFTGHRADPNLLQDVQMRLGYIDVASHVECVKEI